MAALFLLKLKWRCLRNVPERGNNDYTFLIFGLIFCLIIAFIFLSTSVVMETDGGREAARHTARAHCLHPTPSPFAPNFKFRLLTQFPFSFCPSVPPTVPQKHLCPPHIWPFSPVSLSPSLLVSELLARVTETAELIDGNAGNVV